MKTIKNYNSFVNEELNTSTYLSAADKLKKKGHERRANVLKQHAHDTTIVPVDITFDDKTFTLTDKNILFDEHGSDIQVEIVYDMEYFEKLNNGDYDSIWNELTKKDKDYFVNQYKNTKQEYKDFTDQEQEAFEEFCMMNQYLTNIYVDDKGRIDSDGLILDRKNAVKLSRIVKQWSEIQGGKAKELLQNLSANDLYSD